MKKLSPFLWLSPAITKAGAILKIDAHYFFKGSILQTSSFITLTIQGLIAGYLIARILPQEEYGEYRFILLIIGIVSTLCIPALSNALAIRIAKDKENSPILYTAKVYCILCSIAALTFLAAIPLLPLWNREGLIPLFIVAALLFVPRQVSQIIFEGIVVGASKFHLNVWKNLCSSILLIVLIIVALFVFPSPASLLLVMLGVPMIVTTIFLVREAKKFPIKTKDSSDIKYGINLSINNLPLNLAWYVDGLLISGYFGMSQLALFSIATLIPEQIKAFSKSLLPITLSRQANGHDTIERRKQLQHSVVVLCGVFALIIGLYIVVSPWVIPLLFPMYNAKDVIPLTSLYALTLLTTPTNLFVQYMEARKMTKEIRAIQLSTSAVFVLTSFVLIPQFGILGAIISRGIFRVLIALFFWIALSRTKMRITN